MNLAKSTSALAFLFFGLVSFAGTTGCASPIADDEDASESDEATSEAALAACGSAAYATANTHYKNAVAWSKERNAGRICESDNAYQWGIADEASRAVMTCGAFRDVIKTSTWAAPLRKALAPSLTLKSLTGELAVIKDSKYQNWTGVEGLLAGRTFWAQTNGAYGSHVIVRLEPNGKAVWRELQFHPVTGEAAFKDIASTFTVTKTGSASAPRSIAIKHGWRTDTFTLGIENPTEYKAAPIFVLRPKASTSPELAPQLYSLVSECDA